MTREEQRQQAAEEYGYTNPNGSWNENDYEFDYEIPAMDFKAGAEWADEHPKEGLWNKDKVIAWVKENAQKYTYSDGWGDAYIDEERLVDDLTKAMEQ